MELITLIRGNKIWVDDFKTQMQGVYLPFPMKQADGTWKDGQLQMGVRPYEIIGFAFPKGMRDLCLNTILSPETKGKSQHKSHNKWFAMLRKIMGLKKIPDWTEDRVITAGVLGKQNLEIIGIGIKEDEETPNNEGV